MVNSRAKGKRGELQAVKAIKEHWPFPKARRSQQFCGAEGDADIAETPGLHVEVKNIKAIAAIGYLEQAERDARSGDCPVVLMKKRMDPEFVLMLRLRDTEKFIHAYQEAKAALRQAA